MEGEDVLNQQIIADMLGDIKKYELLGEKKLYFVFFIHKPVQHLESNSSNKKWQTLESKVLEVAQDIHSECDKENGKYNKEDIDEVITSLDQISEDFFQIIGE
jgi:hypothetical protein